LNSNISFITFNYDRSLEYLLFNSIQASFGLSINKTLEIFTSIPIIHIYGSLGDPDFLTIHDNNNKLPYGAELSLKNIRIAIDNINIISEDGPLKYSSEISNLISKSDKICFLGFGYNRINLARLFFNDYLDNKSIYGSVFGLGNAELSEIKSIMKSFYQKSPPKFKFGSSSERSIDILTNHLPFSITWL